MRPPRKLRVRRSLSVWLSAMVVVAAAVLGASPAAAGVVGERAAAVDSVAVEPVCGPSEAGRATCFALRRTDVPATRGVRPEQEVPAGYGPADLRDAYGLPDNGGAGATIAVITAYDNTDAEAELAVYRAQYGLPPCTTDNGCYRIIGQDGGAPPQGSSSGSWAVHAALGLDMASAVAPAAHLLLVTADDNSMTNLGAAVNQAVAQGAKFISNGYGFGVWGFTPGTPEDPGQTTAWDPFFNHPGVAIVAAAGDYGAGVSFPASSRYVTAVGGTSLVRDDSARGWSESVWHSDSHGTGSGCSAYESKPVFQTDRGCANRTVADVSAVADPATGVAIYHNGWHVYGGTSIAAPIVAGVYAVAGTPVAGTYPNSYPYARRAALHDVTKGRTGTCDPAYLCVAGPGYDGPTGLGTPNGSAGFQAGPYGTLTGTVVDEARKPVPGVSVRAGAVAGDVEQPVPETSARAGAVARDAEASVSGASAGGGGADAVTDLRGRYTLALPPGDYRVEAVKFGYQSAVVDKAAVTDGRTSTVNVGLTGLPRATVRGTVTDASGHGWPLYAKITVEGMPGAVFTDPVTGGYEVDLPRDRTYRLTVASAVAGYRAAQTTVAVASAGEVRADVGLTMDAEECVAPGYRADLTGDTETFDDPSAPAGWAVHNATDGGWRFDDPGKRGNHTGGSGGFAAVDGETFGENRKADTTLTAPAVDLRAATTPVVSFDTDYRDYGFSEASVELSVDGGSDWTTIWHDKEGLPGPVNVRIPIPRAVGKADVRVRLHYTTHWANWWQVDNVFVGDRDCVPVAGGLVVGRVIDGNTGAGVVGAQVGTPEPDGATATTAATVDNPWLGDGFYTLFAPAGTGRVTATGHRYTAVTMPVKVLVDAAVRTDISLLAGRVKVGRAAVEQAVGLGATGTATVRLTNTGTAPATITVGEQPRGLQPMAAGGGPAVPTQRVAGDFSPHRITGQPSAGNARQPSRTKTDARTDTGLTTGASWNPIGDLPRPTTDNMAAAHGGKLYSAFGVVESPGHEFSPTAALYAYEPATATWSQLASATKARYSPIGGFIGDRLYATGGLRADGSVDPTTEVYDPATNTWTAGKTAMPVPYASAGSAVVGGRLYVVGGCTDYTCGSSDVQVYDPVSDTWSRAADYPEVVSWSSCGGIDRLLYCAGGVREYGDDYHWATTSTYSYDPATNTWTPRASLPVTLWGAATATANGRLLVTGGISQSDLTNESHAYDPATDSWTKLPNSGQPTHRAAGACGFFRVGGSDSMSRPVRGAEVLPGYADCADTSSWLSTSTDRVTLQPGASAALTVTLDARLATISQPGTYTSQLVLEADTPYPAITLPVTMTVSPPPTWGKLSGKVTRAADGAPLPDATVQIDTWASSYTLATNDKGEYQVWLDAGHNPVQIIATKENYQPQTRTLTITPAATTNASFALKKKP